MLLRTLLFVCFAYVYGIAGAVSSINVAAAEESSLTLKAICLHQLDAEKLDKLVDYDAAFNEFPLYNSTKNTVVVLLNFSLSSQLAQFTSYSIRAPPPY